MLSCKLHSFSDTLGFFFVHPKYTLNAAHVPSRRRRQYHGPFAIIAVLGTSLMGCGNVTVPPPSQPAQHPNPNVSMKLSSLESSLLGGQSDQFTATISGAPPSAIDWTVNGTLGGAASTGLISSAGSYTAPIQFNGTVTIGAQLHQDISIASSLSLRVVSPVNTDGQISFGFSLPESAQTSAGVYDSKLHLVRTLWSNKALPAGPHLEMWDGVDDQGNHLDPLKYQVKLLYNNVSYEWGVIGDTSATLAGPNNWDAQGLFPMDAVQHESGVITANGYAEGRPNASTFQVSDPQSPQAYFNIGQNVELNFAATDGNIAYFGNVGNGWAGSVAFILAYDVTSRRPYNFPNGSKVANGNYPVGGAIDLDASLPVLSGNSRRHLPTGLAVQKTGKLLAVSHGSYTMRDFAFTSAGEEQITLFDKMSGALLGKIPMHDPQRIAFAASGDLWAISGTDVIRITSIGFGNRVVVRLNGISKPLAIAVDPVTDDVLVADGGTSQQVKRFSQDGRLMLSYGQSGGYTDCSPSVTTDRLYLDTTAGTGAGNQTPGTWIAVGNDSSFWVGDGGNDRALHISSAGEYLEQFSFLRNVYTVTADHGDSTRIFADLLEYKVDYSQELLPGNPDPIKGGNGSWALVKNWSACLPPRYSAALSRVNTLSDGRTYAQILNSNSKSRVSGAYLLELVELPKSGPVRPSGQILEDGGYNKYIDDVGDLAYWKISQTTIPTSTLTAYKQSFLREDSDGFPVWDDARVIGMATSNGTPYSSLDPFGFGGWGMSTFPKPTDNGYLVTYKTAVALNGTAFHLGGLAVGGVDWSWKTSRGGIISTPDGRGTFPEVDSYGGHDGIAALVEGSNIIEGYDGQYGSFSSQWMLWRDNGLMIGQFGHPANGDAPNGSLYPGAAGNIAAMASITVKSNIYLYNSDESYHPGIHRWKISGLETIHELNAITPLGETAILTAH